MMSDAGENLLIRDNPARSRFEIDLGDGTSAFAAYELEANCIVFTHTVVPSQYEGLKVIPRCPFFAAYIRKHPEEQDLLAPAGRRELGLD
jgi:uncharacterized protein